MITFISGLPGHGKTLYTIDYVRKYVEQEYKDAVKQAESEGKPITEVEKRPVYQHGVNGLKLQWQELEQVEDWHRLPMGSIIVIDEAQKHFPAMSNSAKRPKHYTEFDTHRHSGYDIFLITQDPVNVDVRPRSMSERHFHLSRSFGVKAATLYEFQSVQLVSSERYKRIESSIKSQWKYPEDVFDLYKSAEVHTHKRRLPWKKIAMFTAPAVACVAVAVVGANFIWRDRELPIQGGNQTSDQSNQTGYKGTPARPITPPSTIAQSKPTVPDDVLTVPMYQHLIRVKSYQRIDGCGSMQFGNRIECTCNDQRGNKIPDISIKACIDYVKNGYFDYSIDDPRQQQSTFSSRNIDTPPGQTGLEASGLN